MVKESMVSPEEWEKSENTAFTNLIRAQYWKLQSLQ